MKNHAGFTYIEIIVALALFAITLAAVLPVLSHAGRNMAYAQEGYIAHLRANHLVLLVRDALHMGENAQDYALAYSAARGNFPFTVWVGGSVLATENAPNAAVHITGFVPQGGHQFIKAVVWDKQGNIRGRAMGFA
ncbi:MAG: prepilin-type N-terminal cleavage/methylation domain-containing protein [Defluviitaleaceae bacterium]|nr:prepilin-type N-terminal cleavage/methylation domain-containing protein [Defluviitaleaceae bacterium]MCL2274287.1 prepilin-type N-terminal cleavage/methylation domain-containing protein [Defluviitaleaceae bacterium]